MFAALRLRNFALLWIGGLVSSIGDLVLFVALPFYVYALTGSTLATGVFWLLIPLAYGFWARVLTGPTLSPVGWLAQNVIAPRLGERKPVPGPPKRFAQGMGAAMSSVALFLAGRPSSRLGRRSHPTGRTNTGLV